VTPAAAPEIRTPGLDAMRRGLKNGIQPRPRKSRLLLREGCLDVLALENKRHKHRLAPPLLIRRKPRQPVPAINQLFNREFQAMILCYEEGDENLAQRGTLPLSNQRLYQLSICHPDRSAGEAKRSGGTRCSIRFRHYTARPAATPELHAH
jgi:hypothetical protein